MRFYNVDDTTDPYPSLYTLMNTATPKHRMSRVVWDRRNNRQGDFNSAGINKTGNVIFSEAAVNLHEESGNLWVPFSYLKDYNTFEEFEAAFTGFLTPTPGEVAKLMYASRIAQEEATVNENLDKVDSYHAMLETAYSEVNLHRQVMIALQAQSRSISRRFRKDVLRAQSIARVVVTQEYISISPKTPWSISHVYAGVKHTLNYASGQLEFRAYFAETRTFIVCQNDGRTPQEKRLSFSCLHPHVNSEQIPCLGHDQSRMIEAFRTGALLELVTMALLFLQNYRENYAYSEYPTWESKFTVIYEKTEVEPLEEETLAEVAPAPREEGARV